MALYIPTPLSLLLYCAKNPLVTCVKKMMMMPLFTVTHHDGCDVNNLVAGLSGLIVSYQVLGLSTPPKHLSSRFSEPGASVLAGCS